MSLITAYELSLKQPDPPKILLCKINGILSDLSTNVSPTDSIEFLSFDSDDAKFVFWHSSAHVLGSAILNLYPNSKLVSSGQNDGFFYDVWMKEPFTPEKYDELEEECKKIIKKNFKFERFFMKKSELLDFYAQNEFKSYFVTEKGAENSCCYKLGAFVDFCGGPHIFSSGDVNKPQLQRIKGISFPDKKLMTEYLDFVRKAEENDHRRLGTELNLYFWHPHSPGCAFFLPDGTVIYNNLMSFLREEYRKRGFVEVMTPLLFSTDLWKESGHYDNYRENMFLIEDIGLKPMNCPGHCLIFNHTERVYKELPLRLADFGVLHRNELRGTLSGLTRVRKFQQDDAHIFCSRSQVRTEISGAIEFLEHVYGTLGFSFELNLSTRPEKFMGEIADWDNAERDLVEALGRRSYKLNPGDGAFYGPKIDVLITDALKRKHQCATIQLDFQLPIRFGLKFKNSEGSFETPVIIHRAIMGSFERMIAILVENFGKNMPLWLSPRQIAIVPVSAQFNEYALHLKDFFSDFHVKMFTEESVSFNKKIRSAVTKGFCIVAVVGEIEKEKKTVSLRLENSNLEVEIDVLLKNLREMVQKRTKLSYKEEYCGGESKVEELKDKIKNLF